ncbi:hypothetical protein BC628DRAFT_503211 [Trametes gibbosa]|nr:hypothetical protein BC628DRAFT_503211 [Trametes gibbosa]
MTRGRRKDMTIPPSRALLQQRDYRARKAQYLADLELRVKKAEEENAHLRQEVETLQSKLKNAVPPPAQSPYGPEVVCLRPTMLARRPPLTTPSLPPSQAAASSDLMHHLAVASASITRFQQLAFHPGGAGSGGHHVNRTPITLATPTYTPSPVAPPHAHKLSVSPRIELPPLATPDRPLSDRERAPYREPLPSVYPHRSLPSSVMGPAPQHAHARYPGPKDPDCCGGYVDCRGLVEDDEDDDEDEDEEMEMEVERERGSMHSADGHRARARFAQRMSDVRSTTSSSGPEDGMGSHAARAR